MAKASTVSPTMEPNISRGDKDEDEYEEEDWVASDGFVAWKTKTFYRE